MFDREPNAFKDILQTIPAETIMQRARLADSFGDEAAQSDRPADVGSFPKRSTAERALGAF